jgi:hypothetical protein
MLGRERKRTVSLASLTIQIPATFRYHDLDRTAKVYLHAKGRTSLGYGGPLQALQRRVNLGGNMGTLNGYINYLYGSKAI